ncbi:WD40 repeat domain-containing protein [Nocardia asteroides]|uniref:WD40 repeat domain-containing protein n=1 Tax=Nocardia asteroides TaxID=1824 RepID=UPI0037B15235
MAAKTFDPKGGLAARIRGRNGIAFSPDSTMLATFEEDDLVRFWHPETNQVGGPPLDHGGRVWSLAFRPDGLLVATGGDNGTVKLWEFGSRRLVGELRAAATPIWFVCFSPDGTHIAAAGLGGTVPIWKAVPSRSQS